jgi:hypothetical protein
MILVQQPTEETFKTQAISTMRTSAILTLKQAKSFSVSDDMRMMTGQE